MTRPIEVDTIAVDVGGTFTDVTAVDQEGRLHTAKVLSTPPDYSRGILEGIRSAVGDGQLPPHLVIHGTTIATNAVLSRRGLGRAAVVTTRGFRDVLEIGRTKRPNLYDINWDKPEPLVTRDLVFEIGERTLPDGTVEQAPTPEELEELAAAIASAEVDAVAISFINSYANPENEELVARELVRAGCAPFVVASTSLTREIQEFERTSTAALNAVLLPPVDRYLATLSSLLEEQGATGLFVMQSNGGLVPSQAAAERPVTLLESGPAAGVLGAVRFADSMGLDKVIAFDMGGTTAKACLIEGGVPREAPEYEVGGELNTANPLLRGGGYPVRLPCFELSEVGAGGGSIARVDDAGALRVGPESAGAHPGPACYGLGGESPAVADAQVVLGYLPETALGYGTVAMRPDLARAALASRVADAMGISVEEAAAGVYALANTTMARAIRAVSIERGRDPSEYALIAFGGSGGIHAVDTARELGISRVLVPPAAGVFSALGMTAANLRRDAVMSVQWALASLSTERVAEELGRLEAGLRQEFEDMAVTTAGLRFRLSVDMRYRGQTGRVEIPVIDDPPNLEKLLRAFEDEHEQLYGHRSTGDVVEMVALRVSAVVPGPGSATTHEARATSGPEVIQRRAFFEDGGWVDVDVISDRVLLEGGRAGPLIVQEEQSTVVIPPDCRAELDGGGAIVITLPGTRHRGGLDTSRRAIGVIRHRLEAIVDDMASLIPQTARSIIARESHDFSTALCAPDGSLVAQGLGVLVHLGSVPGAIQAVLERYGDSLEPGDIVCLNDPYEGGTHLPDYVLVAPLFTDEVLTGHAVVISHHSDIGGGVPGGHATGATDLFQEGLVAPPVRLVRRGEVDDDTWRLVLRNSRTPDDVGGDLRAQIAACVKAQSELSELVDEVGREALGEAMVALVDYTETLTRTAIGRLPNGSWSATDYLDDDGSGKPLELTVDLTIYDDHVEADFSRSSPQVANGLNCNWGTLVGGVFLAFRCVFDEQIPDNAGFMRCFRVWSEPGTVVNPIDPAPFAARGLTAFRLADLMFRVMAKVVPGRVWAAGEGGLSVVTIGGRGPDGGYLLMDTVGGGSGARPGKDGVEGVAPAVGNVRNNSLEVMERDFPVRLLDYGFVPDTGGAGKYRGANAMVKQYEFLGDQGTSFVRSDRRQILPWGLEGGGPGAPSLVELRRAGAERWETLPIMHVFQIHRGDRLRVTTAGAGGYGPVDERASEAVERDRREGRVTSWPPERESTTVGG